MNCINRDVSINSGTFFLKYLGALAAIFGAWSLYGAAPRDFITFLPSGQRQYVGDAKLNAANAAWPRAWIVRDEKWNGVTNVFLDVDHPESFPAELFPGTGATDTSAGGNRMFSDPKLQKSIEPYVQPGEKPPKDVPRLAVTRAEFAAEVARLGLKSVDPAAVPDALFDFWREQLQETADQISGRIPLPPDAEKQVQDRNTLVFPGEATPFAVVRRRTGVLLADLRRRGVDTSALDADFVRLFSVPRDAETSAAAMAAAALRRRAFLSDPRLDALDRLVFLARASYAGCRLTNAANSDGMGGHFNTQVYGFNTIRGGGLFTVDGWRAAEPRPVNLLAGCVVTNGPSAGRTLDDGSFYSFDVSWDGRTVFFTHTAAKLHKWIWDETTTWKIFRLDLATRKIAQLTFGPWNDFDPVELPDGRVVFCSERRGGFIRCFTKGANLRVTTYTLHSMKSDGSDVFPISYYETSEWQPSVDNDGRLVYTRWDYTDRDDCLGSRFWTCGPDGTNPRAPHGNYPYPWHTFADNVHKDHQVGACPEARHGLPRTEMGIRAIPGSHRYMFTAAPHHGETFGSICTLDLREPDDYGMSQIRRVTPYVKFPESECAARGQYQYGTPWPVDEGLFLCNRWEDLVVRDRFGNEELVVAREQLPIGYDPRLRLTHARPLAARSRPPVLARRTKQGVDFPPPRPRATIGVADVRRSDQPFPEGRTPTRLRVLQAILKPDPWMDLPFIGYEQENTPRIPLGTVPIESDGSAYFEAPAGKEFIFQVLDQNNMAIQTMRSTTFVHPGESLTCVGCHESPQEASQTETGTALAFRRAPSKLEPEGLGVEPVTFARLVAPIFTNTCVACHRRTGKGPQQLDYAGAKPYTFRFAGGFGGSIMKPVVGGSRSVPGRCGAAASKMGQALLTETHRKAVPEAERRRVLLWLDANALRYGAYHDLDRQERGERVWPLLDVDPDNPLADCD